MKAVTVALVAGLALATGAATASAQEGLYAGAQIGFSGGGGEDIDFAGVDMEFDTGTVISSFVGKDLGNQIRIEGELAYRQNDMATYGGFPVSGEMSSLAFMGNAYYDFGDGSDFTPYLGIGMGFANVTMNSIFYSTYDTDTTFALQLMAGGSFPVGEGLAMTIDLRSFGAVPTFVDTGGFPFRHGYGVGSIMLGLRGSF